MNVSSAVIPAIQATVGTGEGIQIPEAALLTLPYLPLPLQATQQTVSKDLRGGTASFLGVFVINQGASSGPLTADWITFDRGIYRITGRIMSVTFVGPAASSASIRAAFAAIVDPGNNVAMPLGFTGLVPLTQALTDDFDIVVQFPQSGFILRVGAFVASGVGQSMAIETRAYVQRLL